MIGRKWMLVLAMGSFAAGSAVAQEAESPAAEQPANEIVVEILGLRSDQGQVGCRIFSKADGFPGEMKKADLQLYAKPKSKKGGCTFKGFKPGTYAITVMHDLDKSGDLNTSLVGRPKEPWGFRTIRRRGVSALPSSRTARSSTTVGRRSSRLSCRSSGARMGSLMKRYASSG